MIQYLPLSGLTGVANNSLAQVTTQSVYNYHSFIFKLTNIPVAKLKEIKLSVDSIDVQTWTGSALNSCNKYKGIEDGAVYLELPLTRKGMLERYDEYLTGITLGVPDDIGDVKNVIRIEARIDDGVVNPQMEIIAVVDDAIPKHEGTMVFVKRTQIDIEGLYHNTERLLSIRNKQQAFLDLMFIRSNNIQRVEITLNDKPIRKMDRALMEFRERSGVRNPQPGFLAIDFSENGYGQQKDLMNLFAASMARFEFFTTASEACETFIVTVGRLR